MGLETGARDVAKQLTSELVTNCVRHGAGLTFKLHMKQSEDRLRIEVLDSGSVGSPQVRKAGEADLSGRGLFLVDKLSLDWGIEVSDCTKVWFEVPLALSSSRAV